MNEWEERARQEKVDRICSHLRAVHGHLPVPSFHLWSFDDSESGKGFPHPPMSIVEWVSQESFPWDAIARAAGCRPPSDKTKALVIAELSERASYVRSGMAHTAAGPAELEGATTNLHHKANQRAKVYGLIVSSGSTGKTGAEISELLDIPRHVLSARLRELENDGLIQKSGDRRLATSGVRNSIYVKAVA